MNHVRIALFSMVTAAAGGCTAPSYFHTEPQFLADSPPAAVGDTPWKLPMFAGHDGSPMNWHDLIAAIAWAEIIIIGEQHDDAMGHAFQLAVVENTLDFWPRSALSMEMLERDEQVLVDDYLEDIIDQPTFVRLTFSANWGGEGTWDDWFQPIIDAAKKRGSRVIAANAPRRYVRLARTAGYQALDALPAQRRAYFDRPRQLPRDHYFERFSRVMSHIDEPASLNAIFRSQMVWDATMAQSIVRFRPSRTRKVVHLVGQFHSDFQGGLVQQIRKARPTARVLILSMQRHDALQLREADRGRADVVIYTGERPADDDPEEPEDETAHPEAHS